MPPDRLIYPLTFRPVLKHYPWGGRNLERLGRRLPEGIVAESWEVSGHAHGPTPVADGPLAGLEIAELQRRLGEELLGRRHAAAPDRRFPLLVKLLDAHDWLSVQVHPGDEYALANEGELGKSELWVVLQADEGAELIHGFRPGADRESFAAAIAAGRAPEMLHRSAARTGDAFYVPAGTVHALGPGLVLAEIQQSSDATYRIYDWGRPRPLHVDKALEVLDFGRVEPGPVSPATVSREEARVEELARSPHFLVERLRLAREGVTEGACRGETFEIWGVLRGSATLSWDGPARSLAAVSWVLLPAALGEFEIRAEEEAELLRVLPPEHAPTGR